MPQLVNPGEVREEALLPSFLYLPGSSDFPAGTLALPWDAERGIRGGTTGAEAWRGKCGAAGVVGEIVALAFGRGSHLAAAAVPRARRRGEDLAGGGQPPVLGTSARVVGFHRCPMRRWRTSTCWSRCRHPSTRWRANSRWRRPGKRASSDITLLEEPQAAFYAWIERHPDWRERVQPGDLILVVDVGGGTTDFTLIAVTESHGELALDRVAVGDHILLGGDNIDLALAGVVSARLAEKGTRLDSRQMQSLWNNCRVAKERLLQPDSTAQEQPVTILGKGTGLVGGTIKALLQRSDIETVLGEGFLPAVSSSDMPAAQRRVGLQELGLPYAADAGITRHMARFLRQQTSGAQQGGGASRRQRSGVSDACAVQRRCVERADGPRAASGDTGFLVGGGRLAAGQAAQRRRSDARSGARRRLLRDRAHRPRRPHPWRCAAHVLCRRGERHAFDTGCSRAAQSVRGGAVRHGRGHRSRDSGPRVWPDRGRARRVPLLHLQRPQER